MICCYALFLLFRPCDLFELLQRIAVQVSKQRSGHYIEAVSDASEGQLLLGVLWNFGGNNVPLTVAEAADVDLGSAATESGDLLDVGIGYREGDKLNLELLSKLF